MKQMALRTTLLTGLGVFAVLWTLLMGIGVSGVSPAAGGARQDAAQFGAGAHIMYVDESNFPDVTVYLAVNDDAGQPILGLEQVEFVLREDGKPAVITSFVGAGGGATSTVLVIDQSGSMGDDDKMSGAIRAAQSYLDFLNSGRDRLGIIVFSNWSLTMAPLDVVTDNGRSMLHGLLGGLFPLAGTEFYAATVEGIKLLDGVAGRRVVLALTDGMDNNGQTRLQETIDAALAANIPIYVVGLGNDVDRNGLQRLAAATNGQVHFSPNAAELEQLYESIASNLHNEYALTYHSLTPNLDGTRRDLAVDIGAAAGNISVSGGYAVGGILASSLNLAVFLPTLLLLLATLVGMLFVPGVTRPRIRRKATVDRAETPHQLSETGSKTAQAEPRSQIVLVRPSHDEPRLVPALTCVVTMPVADGTTLGSSVHNTWVLNSAGVAAHQARITMAGNRYVIADMTGLGATKVSYDGSPERLRPIQQNALCDGSRIVMGELALIFRETPAGAALERHYTLPASGVLIGVAPSADIIVSSAQPVAIRIRHDGRHWAVECDAGECLVSYSGDPAHLRPVTQRNALQPGSLVQVGALTVQIDAA